MDHVCLVSRNVRLCFHGRLGGNAVVEAAVEMFYKKLLGDVRVARFFSGIPLSGSKPSRHALSLLASSDIALMSSHCSPEGTNKCPSQGKLDICYKICT